MVDYHIEINFQQNRPKGEIVCGDVFYSRRIKEEGRTILVLSDGIGHGVKANVLATLTVSMALNYSSLHTQPDIAADIFMRVLPRSSEGKENYATFTIIEVEDEGKVRIINYDNPPTLIIRHEKIYQPKEKRITIRGEKNQGKIIRIKEFQPIKEDRLIFMTDGVTQSGLGSKRYPMGWELENITDFVKTQIAREPDISAGRLSKRIISRSAMNDGFEIKDDTSCGVIYFRQAREFMLITGPPFYKVKDFDFVNTIKNFNGKKIICGGTTAEIIARELNLEVKIEHRFRDEDIPPTAEMEGFEMITEGILTLGKVEEVLENYNNEVLLEDSPPEEVVKLLLNHDFIHIIVGTRINWAHQDPDQPVQLEIRKFVIKRIIKILEEKFFKKVKVDYI